MGRVGLYFRCSVRDQIPSPPHSTPVLVIVSQSQPSAAKPRFKVTINSFCFMRSAPLDPIHLQWRFPLQGWNICKTGEPTPIKILLAMLVGFLPLFLLLNLIQRSSLLTMITPFKLGRNDLLHTTTISRVILQPRACGS